MVRIPLWLSKRKSKALQFSINTYAKELNIVVPPGYRLYYLVCPYIYLLPE